MIIYSGTMGRQNPLGAPETSQQTVNPLHYFCSLSFSLWLGVALATNLPTSWLNEGHLFWSKIYSNSARSQTTKVALCISKEYRYFLA